MRTLIVGAGATGGAIGARMLAAGRDVSFLVRDQRAAALRATGLVFRAPGEEIVWNPSLLTEVHETFDLVIVAVKAPAVKAVIEQIRPAVGPETLVVPLLNGMRHVDLLVEAFGDRVLGGLIKIVGTIDAEGRVVQMTKLAWLTVGRLDGAAMPDALVEELTVAGFRLTVSDDIGAGLWAKWSFIAAAGVVSCLFRGEVRDVLQAGGEPLILAAIAECEAVSAAAGHPVDAQAHQGSVSMLTEPGSRFTSSLYRDLLHGDAQEGEHILGDLAARARQLGVATPLLDATVVQVRAHRIAAERAASA